MNIAEYFEELIFDYDHCYRRQFHLDARIVELHFTAVHQFLVLLMLFTSVSSLLHSNLILTSNFNLKMNELPTTPADLRNVVTEILRSDEFCNQLQCSIERASSNRVSYNTLAPSQQVAMATPAEELRRLFPSLARGRPNYSSKRTNKRKRGEKIPVLDFKRDVILVTKPEVTKTLNGHQKSLAYANGYAVSAATFQRTWTKQEIFEYINHLFQEKLHDINFEIMVPIAGTLVRPNLPEDSVLDGAIMCRLFTQKTVYVRPLCEIDNNTEQSEVDDHSNYRLQNTSNQNNDVLAVNHISTDNDIESVDDQYDSSNISCNLEDNLSTVKIINEEDVIEHVFEYETSVGIIRSLEVEKKEESLVDILRQLHSRIDTETTSQFNIYREDIFNCCIRALRRKNFSPLNKISVMFTDIDNVSEGAVDMGGPTREMFRLLLKYLENSTLFEGPQNSKNITLCSEHLESKHYYEAGRIIALSLIHGGPSPQFFSETFFTYLVSGVEATKPKIGEIMNIEIKKELEGIRDASDLPELQLQIWNSTFMTIAGFGNVTCFDKKTTIFESATRYYLIHRVMPALEQFKEGLNILGLLEKLKIFKTEFKALMCYTDSKVTAERISSTFKVKLSEAGSNSRNIESRILSFWNDFLLDCQEGESQATLEDVLCFATASEKIPLLGYENQPQLEFLHNENFLWPKANTCTPILYLPTSYKINEYETFKKNMNYAILNGMQFGFA